ncbi:hydroxyisourate hydrolase [Alteromonas gilva]|uniref:5-hydroxyisourate hydrolase n=1 Tax=Alteromonas gilva TaxID=2987522 RepID=A0ABT5L4N5_9ALTE|nr:hydroxyisourate hydrolase [Alteromonas gilva]MDC8831461.1 hydroxyisourate hydrolase [Alteromonas gilva]
MISLSSHVLDTTSGKPVADLPITLTCPDGSAVSAVTNSDGRCKDWPGVSFTGGIYQLRFECDRYLRSTHGESFYPFVDIHFEMTDAGGHYHVPLLISPFGFSSYRGS